MFPFCIIDMGSGSQAQYVVGKSMTKNILKNNVKFVCGLVINISFWM